MQRIAGIDSFCLMCTCRCGQESAERELQTTEFFVVRKPETDQLNLFRQ